jgi:hypothetical protein
MKEHLPALGQHSLQKWLPLFVGQSIRTARHGDDIVAFCRNPARRTDDLGFLYTESSQQ